MPTMTRATSTSAPAPRARSHAARCHCDQTSIDIDNSATREVPARNPNVATVAFSGVDLPRAGRTAGV